MRIPITTPKPKPTTKGPLPTSTDAVRFDEANHLGRGESAVTVSLNPVWIKDINGSGKLNTV